MNTLFPVDKTVYAETPDNRLVRAELRLSDRWKVVGKHVEMVCEERSDDVPEFDVVSAAQLRSRQHASRGRVEIFVSAQPGQRYRCPVCGRSCRPLCYEVRRYHHLPEQGCECWIIARIPKLICRGCGGTPQIPFPLSDRCASYTRDLAEEVMSSLTSRSRSSVASDLFISTDIVDSILDRQITDAMKEQDLSHVSGVFLDETQYGHGHDYISVFLDQNHKVIYACRGHGKDVLERFCGHLILQGGDPGNIRFFSTDMSTAYESGILEHFRNAILIWDRFHLIKSLNEALNNVRKRTLKRASGESLKSVKYVVLKHFQNQTPEQEEKMSQIRMVNPELAIAFDMKEVFSDIILIRDRNAMESMLRWWTEWVETEGPKEFVGKVRWIREKIGRILDWTIFPISNSASEGVNKNIQDIRRQACGYRNVQNFFQMIFLRQSELVFRF